MRAAGLNTIETYAAWNLHEYQSGLYDFGSGGSDFEAFLDIVKFIKIAQEEDLFVLLVENEYGNTGNSDPDYLHSLTQIYRDNGIKELLYTSDPPGAGSRGALPNELLMTANFNSDVKGNLDKLDTLQANKPTMTMEFWSGWFDHVSEDHHTVSVDQYKQLYEQILTHPASVNIYMIVGSTNFGFLNGANSLYPGLNNSGLQPDVTSYDYDSPISESGEITDKFTATAELVSKYNPVKSKLPAIPETHERVTFDDIKIEQQILLSEIIDSFPNKIASENIVSMEQLPINNNSGQAFGYIVYRKTNLNLNANALLQITGYVRDHVLVLLNGKLLTPVLSSKDDLNKFGYWRVKDSSITLTNEALEGATLDLVVENNARNNYGGLDQFQQFKGLIEDVLIDDEVIKSWEIVPLEFKKSWNKQLTGWHEVQQTKATPALYRVTFNVEAPLRGTYVNVQDWRKGIVIINGFVLGRTFAVGSQQALYLPAGLLQEGQNEIIVFEHFNAPEYVKFSKDPIWGVGTHIN
ncbi:unnamed protein product [Ceutorhynchus assimilis]|uniref:Beta-galactosidase n=1 Tax=Ceutorhynchus assimilis TaxID=467358 RepID=A0A9N9QSL1_9CUCU|nr:unnamed protein product [Ceutorhynchus assimilis]